MRWRPAGGGHDGGVSELLLELGPLALAILLSPFPIVPVVILLLTDRPVANGGAFLLGWFAGLVLLAGVFTVVTSAIELWDEAPTWAAWARLVLGLSLVGLGVRAWLVRGRSAEPPGWMTALGDYTPSRSGRLGLLLAVANPKSVLLVLAAGVAIGAAEAGTARSAGAALLFAAVSSLAVALPVALRLVLGERVVAPLGAVRTWLVAHNDALVAVVMVAIGLMVAAKGWSAL